MYNCPFQGTDHSYVDKLVHRFADNPHFVKAKHANSIKFTIKHYAGAVSTFLWISILLNFEY